MSDIKPGAVTMAEIRAAYPALGAMADAGAEPLADPESSEWLDGPGLVRWLADRGMDGSWLEKWHPSVARAARHWRDDGSSASVYYVDQLLLDSAWSLHDIPRELWLRAPRRKVPRKVDAVTKQEIINRYLSGESGVALAEEYNLSYRTIGTWVNRRAA